MEAEKAQVEVVMAKLSYRSEFSHENLLQITYLIHDRDDTSPLAQFASASCFEARALICVPRFDFAQQGESSAHECGLFTALPTLSSYCFYTICDS